jgi:hypothetical protein
MVTEMDTGILWNWVLILILAVFVFDVWLRRGWKDRNDED